MAKQTFQWQLNWKIIMFSVLFLPITVCLGLWQLDRAEEKKRLITQYDERKKATSVSFSSIGHQGDRQFIKVVVKGVWRSKPTLLLDNQIRRGKPGFEVNNILDTDNGPLLVNRGWIAGSLDRSWRPEISLLPSKKEVSVEGYLYKAQGKQVMLGEDDWDVAGDLVVVQNARPETVAKKMDEDFYPYILRSDSKDKSLDATWIVINIQPGKHTGYAVQWFALAFALVVLTLFANSNLSEWLKSKRN